MILINQKELNKAWENFSVLYLKNNPVPNYTNKLPIRDKWKYNVQYFIIDKDSNMLVSKVAKIGTPLEAYLFLKKIFI